MAISKRLRYEVLRRDNYTCRYCRTTAPGAVLTVDHVVPATLGGSDDPTNLVAACKDCNSGKTSSSPDAPLVATVSEDALRWAAAMQLAQAEMLADINARAADRDQFRQWWDVWGYGDGADRELFPKDPAWQLTVDQLLAAGLPLAALEDCIDKAMSRRNVGGDAKFRYMCGIAWNKVTELQNAARSVIGACEVNAGVTAEDDLIRGRADLARELLGDLGTGHRDLLLEEAREERQADTEDEQHIAAAHIAWQEVRTGLSWLAFSVCELLTVVPDEVMQSALRQARTELYDENGEDFSRQQFAERAAGIAARSYEERAAAEYLASLPEAERGEWIAYANAAYATKTGVLAGRMAAILPAECARGCRRPADMCHGRGDHIAWCPSKATHRFRFAGAGCCQDAGDDHDAHRFCDRHSVMALDGELSRNGSPVTVQSCHPLPEDAEEMAVPF